MNRGQVEQDGTPEDVFERPATSFVMNFLGSVNIFHGRVESGKAILGPVAVDYPDHPHQESRPAAGYARPHELGVSRSADSNNGLWATLGAVNAAGPVVRLELLDADRRLIQVDLGRSDYEALRPQAGERLFVTLQKLRVFLGESDGLAGSGI
jgi:sulfate transport system ATP-binding protein